MQLTSLQCLIGGPAHLGTGAATQLANMQATDKPVRQRPTPVLPDVDAYVQAMRPHKLWDSSTYGACPYHIRLFANWRVVALKQKVSSDESQKLLNNVCQGCVILRVKRSTSGKARFSAECQHHDKAIANNREAYERKAKYTFAGLAVRIDEDLPWRIGIRFSHRTLIGTESSLRQA